MESPIRRLYLRAGHQALFTKNELCAGKHSGLFEHLFNIEGSFIIHYYHVAGCELRIKYKGHQIAEALFVEQSKFPWCEMRQITTDEELERLVQLSQSTKTCRGFISK